jgi:squalene cyclase
VASVAYLRHQQCASGAFPLELSTAGCTASVDATSFAVQALLVTGGKKATAAALDGARWLTRHQNGNGSFTGNAVNNTNTTGLAAQALRAAGRDSAANGAVRFIRSLQIGCGGKAKNRGEVRYARHADGDPLRATAQAIPALAGVGLADISKSGATRHLTALRCS